MRSNLTRFSPFVRDCPIHHFVRSGFELTTRWRPSFYYDHMSSCNDGIPLFDVDRRRRGSLRGVTGFWGRADRQAFGFSTILLGTTPKMEQMGKPSAFYIYGVLGFISVRGVVRRLPSSVIRRFFKSKICSSQIPGTPVSD